MKAIFLGVGEACDELLPNTAVLVETETSGVRRSVLLDCGFTVPPLYWRQGVDQEELDALWLSHFHGDHFFGTPALILRFWEMKRRKPLIILGHAGVEEIVVQTMNLAYPNFLEKLTYLLEFIPVEPGRSLQAAGLTWDFAVNNHGQRDLAVRIDDGKNSLFYSGDGLFTPETIALAQGCDLAVHEAFKLVEPISGHGSVSQCIDFARKANVACLALVHVQRDERRERYEEILRFIDSIDDLHILLPEPGDELLL